MVLTQPSSRRMVCPFQGTFLLCTRISGSAHPGTTTFPAAERRPARPQWFLRNPAPEEWFARFKELFSFAREYQDQLILERQHFPLLKEGLHGLNGSYATQLRKNGLPVSRNFSPLHANIRISSSWNDNISRC